jgi:glutaredoxin 3
MYHEHKVMEQNDAKSRDLYQEMVKRSARHTVPQIFIDGYHVGGSDDLLAAEAHGRLDELLFGLEQGEAA